MIRICVKSGIKQLPWFAEEAFPFFEAYLGCDDNPAELLHTKMRLISIHLPTKVRVGDQTIAMDFNSASSAAAASKQKLEEIIDFSEANGVENIILHPGHFNTFSEDRYVIIDEIAKYFSSLSNKTVKICIENVPCWMNIAFENEPLCSNEKHLLYFQAKFTGVGFAFDIDHVAINVVFQKVYPKYKDRYLLASDKITLLKEMETEIMKLTSADVEFFSKLVNEAIDDFLRIIDPTVVHATGTDFCRYQSYSALPLLGESLPMGFVGTISGQSACDRINHAKWLQRLINKNMNAVVTMELLLRTDYDYIEQLKKNWEYLNKIISLEAERYVDNHEIG